MGVWDFILDLVLGWIVQIWLRIKPWVEAAIDAAINAVNWIVNNITNFVFNTINNITNVINNIVNTVNNYITNVTQIITSWVASTWANITQFTSWITSNIWGWINGAWTSFTDLSNWVTSRSILAVLGTYVNIGSWLNDQKLKLINWATGGYESLDQERFGDNINLEKAEFREGSNLEKYQSLQNVELKKVREGEFIANLPLQAGYTMSTDYTLSIDMKKNFDFFTIMIVPMLFDAVIWIAEHAAENPDEIAGLMDGIAGAVLFEEIVPISEEQKRREVIEKVLEYLRRRGLDRTIIFKRIEGELYD